MGAGIGNGAGAGRLLSPDEALARVPQREPFRFVDEIVELDARRALGRYRWRPEADFYRGHFPGEPITPGVLLLESMAQAGVVPLALYLLHEELGDAAGRFLPLFTDAEVEFRGLVRPGERVEIESRRVFWRHRKLRVESEMRREDGTTVCSGRLSGMAVAS
jgi:3-hydroxyacyl-[acyl-carrier-protein] dehydratase